MVEHLSQSMNNLFLKLDFTKAWKVDERNQNIRLKNLHVEYVVVRFLLFMVSSGQQQEFDFTYTVYKLLFEIIFFQKFIQNVIPRMLQVVQELIPVDEVIMLFFAHNVLNLGFFTHHKILATISNRIFFISLISKCQYVNYCPLFLLSKEIFIICKLILCRTKHVSYWRFSTKCWNVKSPLLFLTLKPHWISAFRFVISKNSP